MEATVSLTAEKVSAMIEEQALTKEELMAYLRQVMEIHALENNIAMLLGKVVLKGASHLYAGQEAVAVGAVGALFDDALHPTISTPGLMLCCTYNGLIGYYHAWEGIVRCRGGAATVNLLLTAPPPAPTPAPTASAWSSAVL